jgi:hypothetical protein
MWRVRRAKPHLRCLCRSIKSMPSVQDIFFLSGMPEGEILNSQSIKISPSGRNDSQLMT